MKLFILLVILSNFLLAQTNLNELKPINLTQVNMQNLGTGTSSLSYSFTVGQDKKIQHAGYFGDGIRPFLETNPKAVAELDKFKTRRIVSVCGYAGVFVFGGIGLAIGLNEGTGEMEYDPRKGKMIEKQEPKPAGLAFIGLSVVSLIVGGYNYFSAADYMINSVRVFNSNLVSDNNSKFKFNVNPVFENGQSLLSLSVTW